MYHTVCRAKIHKRTVAGHALDLSGKLLANLKGIPEFGLAGLSFVSQHDTNGANCLLALISYFNNAEANGATQQSGHISVLGNTGL